MPKFPDNDEKYYEPVWSGVVCGEEDAVDVGRGSGSCDTDCDCPLCAPYCSTAGYCQDHQRTGRRRIALDLCSKLPKLPLQVYG